MKKKKRYLAFNNKYPKKPQIFTFAHKTLKLS